MFEYNICNQADTELFYRQCRALEGKLPGLRRADFLEDVDGTVVQKYIHNLGRITVKNDFQIGALYVISDFDLLPYFTKN